MRYIFIFFTCIISILRADNTILKEFPNSVNEVADFTHSALENFNEQFLKFKEQPLIDLHFSNTVTRWENIVEPLFTKAAILSFLPLITSELDVIQEADLEVKELQKKLFLSMNDPKVLALFLHFAKDPKNQKAMTPHQIYIVNHILQNIEEESLKKEILSIQKTLSPYKSQSFIYAKGNGKEKTIPKNRKLTLLSWNICFLEGGISMLFGGVLPWQKRIDRIVNKIQELDPDILCLQEVFSPKASLALVQKLQSQYAHFYYDMGPNPVGFSIKTLGIPGGLLVASKYPLKEANFIPYQKGETPSYRAYGFFSADIYSKQQKLAHLVTTHLQPGSEEEDRNYRALQTKAILRTLKDIKTPTLLCGDFNIVKDSQEAQEIFSSYESGSCQGLDWTCCELRDYWWKTKQDTTAFLALPHEKEWLDYFFYLKDSSKKPPNLSTTVLVANDLNFPEKALSDHQALFTTITLNK